jgi:hypothetical protein
MAALADMLQQLRECEPAVALILDTYEETDRIYRQSMEAMGMGGEPSIQVGNTADADVTFDYKTPSSSLNQ